MEADEFNAAPSATPELAALVASLKEPEGAASGGGSLPLTGRTDTDMAYKV